MNNITITNVDVGSVLLEDGSYRDDTFTATGEETYKQGTLLARLTSSGKLQAFVKGGAGGLETPVAVLIDEIVATGAGDFSARPLIAGQVRKERLIIQADGDDSNIDAVVIDQLKDTSIVALNVNEMNILDNQ